MVIGSALIIAVIIVAVIQAANYSALEQKRKAVRNKSAMKQTQMSEETKRLHNQIMSLETEVAQNPADISKTTDLANSYFDIGNFGKAINYYEKVLKVAPDNPNILIDTGVCYFNLSKRILTNNIISRMNRSSINKYRSYRSQLRIKMRLNNCCYPFSIRVCLKCFHFSNQKYNLK